MIGMFHQKSVQLALLMVALVTTSVIIFVPSRNFDAINGIVPIQQVTYQSQGSSPDRLSESMWTAISLPHDWNRTADTQLNRWYQTHFQANPNEPDRLAIYIPMVSQHATLYLNGQWLAQTGDKKPKLERHHNNPVWIELPASLLRPDNTLVIEVAANTAEQGLLSPFYLGPADTLQNAYRLKMLFRVDWVQWCTFTMYLIAFILGLFWLYRRSDTVYGIFALEMFVWATHNLNLFVNRIPVSHRLWEAMTMATLGWTVVLILFFNFHFLERRSPRMERLLLIYSLCGVLFFLLPSTEWILAIGYTVWDACLILFGSYAMIYLAKAYQTPKSFDAWLMMLVGVPILLTGLHDILLVNGLWPRTDGLFIQYSVVPTGLLFSGFLFRRFIESLRLAEQHAEELQQKLMENERQLTAQFEQIKTMELQQVLSAERERMMRDMHDGIGGQLLSIQSNLNQQSETWVVPLKTQIQATVNDLRWVIDSLDPLVNDVPTLLGQMRPRLQALLDTNGIELRWNVQELKTPIFVRPEQSLHLMRIIQEAITNAVKHSGATNVTLTTTDERQTVCIDIDDNGIGLTDETSHSGRGLRNMRYRADAIQAQIQVIALSPGTRIRLQMTDRDHPVH